MKYLHWFIITHIILCIISLSFTQISIIVGYILLGIMLLEIILDVSYTQIKINYIIDNKLKLILFIVYICLILYKALYPSPLLIMQLSILIVFLRVVLTIVRLSNPVGQISEYVKNLYAKPATILLISFFFLIIIGATILMMEFTAKTGKGLVFIDALFTATSAVCVTGLVVVNTAEQFTIWGHIVILILIQTGGLGIMIFSFFTILIVHHKVSLPDKMLLRYILNQEDNSNITKYLSAIVIATLVIEFIGALLLFLGFFNTEGSIFEKLFSSIFHSISAFCNAGFSLFYNNLEDFRQNTLVNIVIASLIILGGISFIVIINGTKIITEKIESTILKKTINPRTSLSLNSTIILKYTGILLLVGTLFIYILEHNNSMKTYGLFEQYLAAFFQSVTLRTAGFNTIPFGELKNSTYLIMCFFMFIGVATGSTGGGIKINNIAIIFASLKTYLKGEKTITIKYYTVSDDRALKSFMIFITAIIALCISLFILTLTESFSFVHLLFEVVSAINTVGISSGITPNLSYIGKVIIIILMFWGRLGALTILSAAGKEEEKVNINLPQADILIG